MSERTEKKPLQETSLQDREAEISSLVKKVIQQREEKGGWGKTTIEIMFREGRPVSYEVTSNTTRKFE